MIRAVVDTNAFVSALISSTGNEALILLSMSSLSDRPISGALAARAVCDSLVIRAAG